MIPWPRTVKAQILTILSFSIAAMVAITLSAFFYVNDALERSIVSSAEQLTGKCRQSIESFLEDVRRISMNTAYQESVQKLLQMDSVRSRVLSVELREQARSTLINAAMLKDSIACIQLFDLNGDLVIESTTALLNEDHNQFIRAPLDDAVYSPVYYKLPNPSWSHGKPPYFYYYMPIFSMEASTLGQRIGLLALCLMPNDISYALKDVSPGGGAAIQLLDADGLILASSDQADIGRDGVVSRERDAPDEYMFTGSSIDNTGWAIQAVIPRSDLAGEYKELSRLITLLMVGVAAILCALCVWLIHEINRPIRDLALYAKRAPEELGLKRLTFKGQNEFKQIADSFNDVLDRVGKLNQDKMELALNQKQWELDALHSQINPHFLYNTLEYIRGMALYHGVEPIVDTSLALARLMRYSIKGAEQSTVEEEIRCASQYAVIILNRFAGRIQVHIDCDEALYSLPVPKMLLQPLVENAVQHGLESKIGKGAVEVSVTRDARGLIYRVSDDGVGMEERELAAIFEEKRGAGLGLYSIQRRIRLIYGDSAPKIGIDSAPGAGTRVTVLLPIGEG